MWHRAVSWRCQQSQDVVELLCPREFQHCNHAVLETAPRKLRIHVLQQGHEIFRCSPNGSGHDAFLLRLATSPLTDMHGQRAAAFHLLIGWKRSTDQEWASDARCFSAFRNHAFYVL